MRLLRKFVWRGYFAFRVAGFFFFGFAAPPKPIARIASLVAALCCRRSSAVTNPRPTPSARFALLNHMLMKGFFIRFVLSRVAGSPPELGLW